MGQTSASSAASDGWSTDAVPLCKHDLSNDIEVGIAEAPALACAPHQIWPVASVDALREDGVVLIPNVFPATTAATLRAHLEAMFEIGMATLASGTESNMFHPVAGQKERYYMPLTLEDKVVVDTVAEALQVLAPFIRDTLECDAPILTLLGSARTSDGAPPQPLHSDDDPTGSGTPDRLTALVALQDIDQKMGPTIFLPGTHTDMRAHAAMDSPTTKARLLRTCPIRLGTMPAGSCTLFNPGVLHKGGGSSDARGRWIFQMSFVPARLVLSCPQVYNAMLGLRVHNLGELERGAIRSLDDDETRRLLCLWSSLLEDEEVKGWIADYQQARMEARMEKYDVELWWYFVRYKVESVFRTCNVY
mmetsp:Transcript_61581/g.179970  ORF Transcript_61581/g.179970 Transcript_61581/m.179970 type:complete len:362 (-) Transcript_61581:889-1974(-)